MLSFERQARSRWPCTAAVCTAQSRSRAACCGTEQGRAYAGHSEFRYAARATGPGPVHTASARGRSRAPGTSASPDCEWPGQQRGGCMHMRRRALPSASNHPASCSGMAGGTEPQRQRGDCSKKHSIIFSTHVHPHPPLAAALALVAPRGVSWAGRSGWACRPRPRGCRPGHGAMAIGRRGVYMFMASCGYC